MSSIERARRRDSQELLRLWEDCILRNRFDKGWNELQSHIFACESFDPYPHCLISKDAGKIMAAVAALPMTLRIGGIDVDAAVITGVATLPEARGRGHMRALMDAAHRSMSDADQPLGLLWGHRDLYHRFGYELCGRKSKYYIPARKFSEPSSEQVCRIRELDPVRDTKLVRGLAGQGNLRLPNLAQDSVLRALQRARHKTYIYDDKDAAAMVTTAHPPEAGTKLLEIYHAAGPWASVLAVLNHLMRDTGCMECAIHNDPLAAELDRNLFHFHEWKHDEHLANVRINNLPRLMEKLEPLLLPNLRELGLSLRLAMDGTAQEWRTPAQPRTIAGSYSRPELTRLLFGPERPSELPFIPAGDRLLNAVFPLPLYVIPCEGI
ncbi:MAG: GNAT family N-acetyltransferase [Elusimicrobiota bacterium]